MLRIDTYYDIRCDVCNKARSIDIDGGFGWWGYDAESFRKLLAEEGWKSVDSKNVCPICADKGE